MTNWLLAIAICAAVFAYWVFCRKKALEHQEKAVKMIEDLFSNENISDKEKNSIYLSYKIMRYWFSLPLMLISSPFFIIYVFASNKYKPEDLINSNSKEFDRFFEVLMQMYMAKNPILSTVFMSLIGVVFVLSLVIGTMLNKVSKVPSYTMLISSVLAKIISIKAKIRHAH